MDGWTMETNVLVSTFRYYRNLLKIIIIGTTNTNTGFVIFHALTGSNRIIQLLDWWFNSTYTSSKPVKYLFRHFFFNFSLFYFLDTPLWILESICNFSKHYIFYQKHVRPQPQPLRDISPKLWYTATHIVYHIKFKKNHYNMILISSVQRDDKLLQPHHLKLL